MGTLSPLPTATELLDQVPDAIVLVDEGGTILYASRRVTSLFGLAPTVLLGQSVETLIPDRLRLRHAARRVAYGRNPQARAMGDSRLPLLGRRADGTAFPVDVQLAPIQGNGEHRMLAVIRDATERYRCVEELRAAKQAADQVARMKSEFLALAAHDLGQPEQILDLTISALARRSPAGSELAELTAQAASALERMRELTHMLMDISRLESGTMRVMAEPVRIADIFADLERQFVPAARAKALRFQSRPSPHVIETDPGLLRGMLSNLVSNAIRYTLDGEVNVCCFTSDDGSLRLAVSDTGIGIPREQMQKIFEDFQRLEEARRVHADGSGLGLGIVRRLASLLQLSVSVQSSVGHGSTFEVAIPRARVYQAA